MSCTRRIFAAAKNGTHKKGAAWRLTYNIIQRLTPFLAKPKYGGYEKIAVRSIPEFVRA